MSAAFEVRITPLLRPVAGQDEAFPEGVQDIPLGDTTLVEQFADPEVNMAINEGRTGQVTLSMHDPIVGDLAPFQQAVWVGFRRPDEELAECILYGQANVTEDYDAETVTLEIADPVFKAQHHYIRRGDWRVIQVEAETVPLLDIDKHRGGLAMHAWSISDVINAARNIPEQQDRGMPVLGMPELMMGDFGGTPAYETADEREKRFEIERGQEVWAIIKQIATDLNGPDIDVAPYFSYEFPQESSYAALMCYDPQGAPEDAAGGNTLGRYLDPADADDPQAGEVIFELGIGVDNLVGVKVTPERPTTHAHVVDRDKVYRETAADADASYDTGAFVDWIEVDYAVPAPLPNLTPGRFRGGPEVDTSVLRARADVQIKMLGRPPKQFTCVMRPSDALVYQFGHPDWAAITGGTGGDWYLGDFVRVRAVKGYRSFSTLARVTGVKIKQEGWNGLPLIEVTLIPAIGGTPGDNEEEDTDVSAPVVALTAPADAATVSGSSVSLTATASDDIAVANVTFYMDGVAMGSGDVSDPYSMTWNTTGTTDGSHTLTAVAMDTSGKTTSSAPVTVTVDNEAAVPPVDPPDPGVNNIYYIDGRKIRKVSDDTEHSMRGMGMHGNSFVFGAENFAEIAAEGFTDLRYNLQWDDIETSPGVFNQAALDYVHTGIARAAAEGLGVRLLALTNSPQWSARVGVIPAWSYDSNGPATPATGFDRPSMFCCLRSHGEAYLRKLVQEFGGYENVYGYEVCNEPDDFPASNVQAGLQTMIDWMRDEPLSADKFFYVTNSYSSQSAADAFNDWDAINWTHGDLIATVHSYYAPNSPTDAGWASNGIRRESSPIYWNAYPTEATSYATANKAGLRAHLSSWKQLGQARNVPVELGEAGVQYNKTTASARLAWAQDMVEAAELEEFVGVFWWIYGVSTSGNPWTASTVYPPSIRPEVLALAGFTSAVP